MKVQTFNASIYNSKAAFNNDLLQKIQEELDKIAGLNKSGLTIDFAPFNKTTHYIVTIWALGKSVEENRSIIDIVERYLTDIGMKYVENTSFLIFNEENIYIEFNAERIQD